MKKRNLVVIALLLGVGVGGYFIYTKVSAKGDSKTAKVADKPKQPKAKPKPAATSENTAPQPAVVSMDDDPIGTLRLEGQVVDADGVGVAGAIVSLTSIPPRLTTSEEDGSFFFDKLIGRGYGLSARNGAFVGGPISHQLTDKSPPALIRLRAGGSVEVTITSQASGEPLSSAAVEMGGAGKRTESADGAGVARFVGVASGFVAMKVSASGYGTKVISAVVPQSAGAEIKVSVALGVGVQVSGTVVDGDGKPVAAAKVSAVRGDFYAFAGGIDDDVKTNTKGAFKLEGVELGKVRFAATHRDFAPGQTDLLDVNGDLDDVKIVVAEGALISGRVITADRNPVPWARITVNPKGGGGFGGFGGRLRGTRADEDGTFEVRGLPRTVMTLLASSDDASSATIEVDIKSVAKKTNLEVVLDVTGTISGVVVDSSGEALSETQVILYADWSSGEYDTERASHRSGDSVTTDGDGRFVFSGLAEGVYMLKPTNDPTNALLWQTEGKRAKTGDTDVRLTLASPGKVKGTVVSKAGQPMTSFTVTVGFPPGHPVADGGGEFLLSDIPPGKYDVKIRGANFGETAVPDVVVKAGETSDLGTIQVARGRIIKGRVVTSGGSPVGGALVMVGANVIGSSDGLSISADATTDEMMGVRRVTADDRGFFRLSGAPSKKVIVVADHTEKGRSRPTKLPASEDDLDITLSLLETGSVEGIVLKGTEPMGRVAVLATPSEARTQMVTAQTDAEGKFSLTRLAAGRYELSAIVGNQMNGRGVTKSITIKGGDSQEVNLTLDVGDVELTVKITPTEGATVNATQVFLFPGTISPKNGEELNEAFLGREGSGASQKLSFENIDAVFEELQPGTMTLCGLPMTGDLSDAQFLLRLQEHATELIVVCKPLTVAESPVKQTAEIVVPEMKPFPVVPAEKQPQRKSHLRSERASL